MDINLNKINRGPINSYKAIKNTASSKSADSEKKVGGNFDSVEIDFSRLFSSAKADIVSNLSAEANIAKIRELQSAYEGDSRPVPAAAVADAILGIG